MHAASSIHPQATTGPGASVRRVRGAVADELHLRVRPGDPSASAAEQAASLYANLMATLAAEGANAGHLVTENVFLRPVAADFAAATAARREALSAIVGGGPASTFIGQAPLEGGAPIVEMLATALLPHGDAASFLPDVHCAASCACAACAAGFRARMVRMGEQVHLHAGNVYGRRDAAGRRDALGSSNAAGGSDAGAGAGHAAAMAEVFDMFVEADRLLAAAGMTFRDVMRTWIHVRDIDRDYAALNQARRDFFASRGIERRPASTGVQGIPFADGHDFSLGLLAVKGPAPLDVPRMSTPTLNEAWTYGADFSRGLRLADPNKVALLVSGTASIDEYGVSVHLGDLDAQVERMLHNIETLLQEQGATTADLVSAITYVKRPEDGPELRRRMDARGFGGFPLAIVDAPLCRPELLCETEAVAVLPLPAEK